MSIFTVAKLLNYY